MDPRPAHLVKILQPSQPRIECVLTSIGIEACPLLEWLHRGLREAGIPVVCVETRHAQRFLSSRPVKTDKNDARGALHPVLRQAEERSGLDGTHLALHSFHPASRLTAALSEHIETEPHTRLRYFCSPHHQDSALYPFIARVSLAQRGVAPIKWTL